MGMLNQQQAAPQPPVQQAQGVPVDAQKLQAHVNNIVKAAHLFMYSKSTSSDYTEELALNVKKFPPKIAAAKTAVMVIMLLVNQSQFKMMQKAVIPAGIMIAGEILDFIGESQNHQPTEQDAHDTIGLFIKEIQEQIDEITGGAQAQPAQQAQQVQQAGA